MLTVGWNAKRFAESKSAHKAARRSVFRAATTMLKTELKSMEYQNDEIRHEINRCHSDLAKYDDKLQVLDNMTQLATQSLEVYFQARMENMRTFVMEQCRIISDGIQEEADHWKEIHAMLQQKLVVPGDLRSYGGGNGLPRAVRQSPGFSRIIEEEEEDEAEEEEDEEAENQHNMTTILQSRTMTPLVTQSLKKARLLASKLSNDISKLNMSTTVHEETMIEEPLPTVPTIPDTHVTLRDVSVIEKTNEMEHIHPNPELSVSLLPCIPTVTPEEEEPETEEEINNKSIASTISDKTFVKTSLKPTFSSDADSDDDDDEDEDTIIEDSIIPDETENARPLLLTADRSIRRPPSRVIPNLDKSIVKQEKVSLKEPLNTSNKSLLSNNKTFDAEKSDFVRPTIVELANTSKLPTIPSAETNEEEEEEENQPVISEEPKPIVELPPVPVETNSKRRTTRRTTTRLLRDNQNVENPPPVEIPVKTRYATRYSTRLASSVSHEEVTVSRRSTMHRRTTRFTSE